MAFHIDENHYNEALRFFIREKGVPVKIILAHADISRSRFYGYLNGSGDLAMSRLLSILEVIHVSLDEFMLYARSLKGINGNMTLQQETPLINEATVESALQTYKQTKDVAAIATAVTQIKTHASEESAGKLLKKLLPTVRNVLCKRHYFSIIDANLLLDVMDSLRYEDLQTILPFVRKTIMQQQASQQAGLEMEITRQQALLTVIYQYTLRAFHEQASADTKRDFELVDSLEPAISDWYTNVIRKLMTVVRTLAVADNEYEARVEYNNILAAVYAIQPQSVWNNYERLMHNNFNDFKTYTMP
ncbi:hypothetical protein [Leuconostoc pseudomesenteroides]|uniref:hypothetical protein n=1 Tax=Leuconostoc pseudomesenteroides TaxID=33968 RepID=UPI0039EC14F4